MGERGDKRRANGAKCIEMKNHPETKQPWGGTGCLGLLWVGWGVGGWGGRGGGCLIPNTRELFSLE